MNAFNNAAQEAVEAAACLNDAEVSVFRGAPALRRQAVTQALLQAETLIAALLRLLPSEPDHCASKTLLKRLAALNAVTLAASLNDDEPIEDLLQVVEECQ